MSSLESRARAALKSAFGYDDFRPGQWDVISAVLKGEDVFAVMPTGSGKSMCYQLPAMVDGGLTVVVSPLIALMQDQVGQMERIGVPAASLNSAEDETRQRDVWRRVKSGDIRLLFVSPERLATGSLTGRLNEIGVKRLAIDEAHCVSQWGHDFRPEYRQLAKARAAFGNVQTIALTATADKATRADIAAELFPREPATFVHSFDRPNLDLAFAAKDRPRRQIEDFLVRHKGGSGIIYSSARERTERLAEHLSSKGIKALPYHAGLDAGTRARHQNVFLQEDGVVMVATVAFGMGINKPDVRFVIHADMPGSIEAYYQEIGRAGRDGLPADTFTLYGLEDMALRRRQIDEKAIGDERRAVEHRRLNSMIALAESATCRRQALLAYFGETSGRCGRCDLCRGGAELYDGSVDAQKVLSAVIRSGERFGANHLADILTGTTSEGVKRHGHEGLKTFGAGADRPRAAWLTTIRQLFGLGALVEANEHGGFGLTDLGARILKGQERAQLRVAKETEARRQRRSERSSRADGLDEETARLFEHLRALRLTIAREEGVAAYMIFPDRVLIEMAQSRPATMRELREVQGVGERKLEQYGRVFLDAIGAFV